MDEEYIFVEKLHRNQNPKEKYFETMLNEFGLEYSLLNPYTVPSYYNCFKIINKNKSFVFILKNHDIVSKPEALKAEKFLKKD
jgi:hypothetical protein